jgi:hypothetical protein
LILAYRNGPRGDDPQIVSTNDQSEMLLTHALQLAADGREDEKAVVELRQLAGNKRSTLRKAERASRLMGYHHELARENLASRLLLAASTQGHLPPPPTQDDTATIELVEAFARLSHHSQWAGLAELEPCLLRLETEVRAGRYGKVEGLGRNLVGPQHGPPAGDTQRTITLSSSDPQLDTEHRRALQNDVETRGAIISQLKSFVGPTCECDHQLLRSQYAFDVARSYLLSD